MAELIRRWLRDKINELSQENRDAAILILYYALEEDYRAWTMSEIGSLLDVSKPRIHQLKELALHRLTKSPGFKQFQLAVDSLQRDEQEVLEGLPARTQELLEVISDLVSPAGR